MNNISTSNPTVDHRFRFYSSKEFPDLPPITWLVQDVLPAQGLASIFGPSGSGKSFLIIDLIAAIVMGVTWFGHETLRCKVLCLVLEGQAGFRKRIRAWEEHSGRCLPEDEARFMFQPFSLNVDHDVADLAEAIKAARGYDVVIIDTLNRSAPNADENNSQHMGMLVSAASKLQEAIDGLVLLVHHTGKDQSRGMRGHSSLYAAMDAAIEVNRHDNNRSWKLLKAKDGEDGQIFPFELVPVEFTDSDGTPANSCVVQPIAQLTKTSAVAAHPKGSNQTLIHQALLELLASSTVRGKGGAADDRSCVDFEFACRAIKDQLPVAAKRQYERTKVAINQLITNGIIMSGEGWLWAA